MIDKFKTDLKNHTSTQLFRKYILNGSCYALDNSQYFDLRERVCKHFNVEFTDVILVGSGKLGFSVKPSKKYMSFGEDSDLDVAIVSTRLFQEIWEQAFLFNKSSAYWPTSKAFFRYLSEGWIRPDKLPVSDYFNFTSEWWDFFNDLTICSDYGPYKIRAGLYHSHFFLKEYQTICIEQCIEEES